MIFSDGQKVYHLTEPHRELTVESFNAVTDTVVARAPAEKFDRSRDKPILITAPSGQFFTRVEVLS
jgi:hypothetical protein